MPRLFSAVVPPDAARAHLAYALAAQGPTVGAPAGLRWTPPERWHVTLGFFGDHDDQDIRSAWLHTRVSGLAAPRLRLAGAGTFRGVLWVGVRAATTTDESAFGDLADAAGATRAGSEGGAQPFRPHVTVARWRPTRPEGADNTAEAGGEGLAGRFARYSGPLFTPGEVLLLRSDFPAGGHTYTTVGSTPLARATPGGR